jgi:hypothetical protein
VPTKTLKPSVFGIIFQSPKFQSITKHFIQEPTKASFSRRLESIDAIPEAYKEFFYQIQAAGHEFPYTILTPPNNGYIYRSAEKLVCEFESEIHILEKRGNSIVDQCFPITDISCMEVRAVLLDSSIKITGVTGKGEPATSTVQFNSVTDYLFTPIMKKIRKADASSNVNALRAEMEKFDKWQKSNFKFMNYARNSLLGGERVIHSILQPEIRTDGIKVFGITYYKTISPAHAGILTDRELIMISEEVRHAGDDRYGGMWEYIPLNKISGLFVHDVSDNMLSLLIQLPHEIHLEFLYQISAREDLNKLLFHFKKMNL